MIFRKKKLPTPEPKKEPERLTQEEWRQVAEYRERLLELERAEAERPNVRDFVRILINGKVGQLIDGMFPPSTQTVFTYYDYTPPRNELERLGRQLSQKSSAAGYYESSFRWSVRLKNGYIIRELRPWEIAKVNDR